MKFYNDGGDPDNAIQNRFTKYLMVAVRRCRSSYLIKQEKVREYEQQMDSFSGWEEYHTESPEDAVIRTLPFIQQVDNEPLLKLFLESDSKAVEAVYLHLVWKKSFGEIARQLEIGYSTVTKYFYRMVHRIREILEEDDG